MYTDEQGTLMLQTHNTHGFVWKRAHAHTYIQADTHSQIRSHAPAHKHMEEGFGTG